jgi:hypothetical protein
MSTYMWFVMKLYFGSLHWAVHCKVLQTVERNVYSVRGLVFPLKKMGRFSGCQKALFYNCWNTTGGGKGMVKKNFYLRQLYGLEFLTQRPKARGSYLIGILPSLVGRAWFLLWSKLKITYRIGLSGITAQLWASVCFSSIVFRHPDLKSRIRSCQ